jgi:hypothetical protein
VGQEVDLSKEQRLRAETWEARLGTSSQHGPSGNSRTNGDLRGQPVGFHTW